ncbi:MAG TPA: tRNA pseudouridine(38-40) synthase TruA [Bacilli bacterium]
MRNLLLVISYDGTTYNGFQTQPGNNTIQDKLEAAICRLTGERVRVSGSGRTDAGVHAKGQTVSFFTNARIPAENWPFALNSLLPGDIVVKHAKEVAHDFDARRSAKRKTYRYSILVSRYPNVFARGQVLHHPRPLAPEKMEKALEALRGEHDFTSFCSIKTKVNSHIRTIYDTNLVVEHDPLAGEDARLIHIYMTGNGFLYNMVRIIVGTLLEIGEGKKQVADMERILAAKDRQQAGPTAPAHGLMLWSVEYC